ncbi:MAG: hypothetical protein BMS9Abin37_1743 [Acidobacteriota bacterium]|nr:MAG: hypothetical protein BMS9Abin37_1743 [Acidobacteriota bacterium]
MTSGNITVEYRDETDVAQRLKDAIDVRSRPREPIEPVSDKVFDAYAGLFSYQPSPLNARVEATEEGSGWRVEKITFDASFADERINALFEAPCRDEAALSNDRLFSGRGLILFFIDRAIG